MKKEMFEELLGSIREAGAILRGRKKPGRRFVIGSSGVRAIRQRTNLSQADFAGLIGVSVKTLQNWEQNRRRPTGPAATLLKIISHEPQFAMKAIHADQGASRIPDPFLRLAGRVSRAVNLSTRPGFRRA